MNNLSQKQIDAKQTYLDRQLNEMLGRYQKAGSNERKAIIKHVDSFLLISSKDERIFWLRFREKLERLNQLN